MKTPAMASLFLALIRSFRIVKSGRQSIMASASASVVHRKTYNRCQLTLREALTLMSQLAAIGQVPKIATKKNATAHAATKTLVTDIAHVMFTV